jgi:outer membrane biosynthesis protein TonB
LAPKADAFIMDRGFLKIIAIAIIVHVVVGGAAAYMQPSDKEEGKNKEDEVFAVVKMDDPKVKQPEKKKPKKKRKVKDAVAMAEKAPNVSRRAIKKISRTKVSKSSSVNSLLKVLSKGSGKAGKTNAIKDLVSNVDAVAASKGAGSTFSIAGAIASLPGSGVNIARQGGGGDVSTLSGDDVAGKGSGIASLGKGKRGGKVRGKVTKMSSGAKVGGALSREDVLRVINAHLHAIQACYERALISTPNLSGRIAFDWTVTKNGRVKGVRVRSSTLGSTKVSSCISNQIKKWKFPRPKGGDARITYPFLFRSVSS